MNDLLRMGVEKGASDIYMTVGLSPVFKINGELIRLEQQAKLMPEDTQRFAYSMMSQNQIAYFEENSEIDFSYSVQGFCRFRINVYRQRGSIGMALRAVPLTVPTLDALGLPSILKELSDLKRGLVLVTGPTGSGKSTTLAAMINHINLTRNANVLTLEDPIEYLHHHEQAMINQRELGSDTKSYANALKSALRQGPDVILIGELNDIDTISTALTAAETGHLVLSTLHTSGVVGTIERLIEVFPQERQQQVRVQLSEVLQGVVSQQLFRRFENDGRVAAMEIMICNPAIRNHIKEGKTHQIINSIQTDKKEGMVLMDFALAELYKGKLISYEDAMAHVMDKDCLTKI